MADAEQEKGSVQGRRDARKERLADKLRENLIRRKGPARVARNEAGQRAARADKRDGATSNADTQRGGAEVPDTSEREP